MKYGRKYLAFILITLIVIAVLAGCSQSAGSKVTKQLELAVKYLAESKFEEAILAYQEVIKIDPKNVVAYKGLAVAYSLHGKLGEAKGALQDGLEKVADPKVLKLALAGVFIDLGSVEQAEAVYQEIINQDDKYFPAYQAYARFLIAQDKEKEAVALLEKALKLDKANHRLSILLAEAYREAGEEEKALAVLKETLNAEPNQGAAYRLLQELYEGRLDELLALGDQYMGQNQPVTGLIIKMMVLEAQGDYDSVIKEFEKVPLEVQRSVEAQILAVKAYLQSGRKQQGKDLLRAIQVDSIRDTVLLADIAGCYLELGDKETARRIATRGIDLDPTAVDSYVVMYRSYENDDVVEANMWLIRYLLNDAAAVNASINELLKAGVSLPDPNHLRQVLAYANDYLPYPAGEIPRLEKGKGFFQFACFY